MNDSGDDEEGHHSEHAHYVSFMARGEENTSSKGISENPASENYWKSLYKCEVSKSINYIHTIANLRSELAGLQNGNKKEPQISKFRM